MMQDDPLEYMYQRLEELKTEAIILGALEATKMSSNGWTRFHKYIGVQGIMAIAFTGAIIYMAIAQIPIPDVLIGLGGAAAGFYFAKNGNNVVAAVRRTP